MEAYKPERVIASDLKCIQQTAAALGYRRATVDARLREASLGRWEGLYKEKLMGSIPEDYRNWRWLSPQT